MNAVYAGPVAVLDNEAVVEVFCLDLRYLCAERVREADSEPRRPVAGHLEVTDLGLNGAVGKDCAVEAVDAPVLDRHVPVAVVSNAFLAVRACPEQRVPVQIDRHAVLGDDEAVRVESSAVEVRVQLDVVSDRVAAGDRGGCCRR